MNGSEIPEPFNDERPHQDGDDQHREEDGAAGLEELTDTDVGFGQPDHFCFSACAAMMPALCSSMICTSSRLREDTIACSSTIGIATTRPSTVVMSAVEIPPAISFGSPVPNSVIDSKVRIMPVTVPSRPSSGATAAMILSAPCHFSSCGVSLRMASSILSSSVSMSSFLFSL